MLWCIYRWKLENKIWLKKVRKLCIKHIIILLFGKLLIASKDNKLIGLWIEGQKHYLRNIKEELVENDNEEILIKTKKWLDRYFLGEKPKIEELDICLNGTFFEKTVWELLKKIPYGEVTTYKELAINVAKKLGKENMSAQAVGGAVGHNPISIIIPCHRVVGTTGSLTGYAGGIDKKVKLLEFENVDMAKLYIPK